MLIIAITGASGAGKGTLAEYLINKKKFRHFSVSNYLKTQLIKQKKETNRDNLISIANKIRKEKGSSYIVEYLLRQAKKQDKNVVIESIRNKKEGDYIKSLKNAYLFSVDADAKKRYQRIVKRAGEKDNVSYKKFLEQEKRETKSRNPNFQNIAKCIEMADYKFTNNKGVSDLHNNVEKVLKEILNSGQEKTNTKYVRPSWDEYFLEIMHAVSKRATCDRGRASCVIVKNKKILVTGYVGSPAGFPHCDDVGHQIKKLIHEDGTITEHCMRTVHAEQNAICQAARRGVAIEGSTVYVSMTPCRTCAMLLINCGIARVYAERKYRAGKESEQMFKKAKIKLEYKYTSTVKY